MANKCPTCHTDNPADTFYCGKCGTSLTAAGKPSVSVTRTLETSTDELTRGTLFAGRYEIIEELGAGGMGCVYRAYDKKLNEEIALKIIKPEIAAESRMVERFRNELKTARKIRHQNVCGMYDLHEEGKILYLTMEYVRGEDLKSLIHRTKTLSVSTALSIAHQIAEGLDEAQKLGVIHRDLKPGNIMIDRDGNAKIMDFGIARLLAGAGTTAEGAVIGTPEYMSPEQVDGKPADARADLYALGVILFEMLTSRVPFEGETPFSIANKHKTEPPPDPRKFNFQVPEALAKIILRCLEKTREKRYQSTQELCVSLSELEKEFPSAEKILPQKRSPLLIDITRSLLTKKAYLLVLSVLVLAVIAIFVWRGLRREEPIFIPTGKPSLAVLPFENMRKDKELDFWGAALAKLSISALRQDARQLTVLGTDTINTALGLLGFEEKTSYSSNDLKAIAAKLRVSHLLTANYLKVGNDFRVLYELKDMKTGNVVGSGGVDKKFEEILTVSDALAAKILTDFKLQMQAQPVRIAKTSAQAYQYYSFGRETERKFKEILESQERKAALTEAAKQEFELALALYKNAIQEDPQFAWPYWGLGDIYQALYIKTKKKENLEQMISYYRQAYDINPQSAGTNCGLGWAYFLKGDNDAAYLLYRKAREVEPDNPVINENIASFYGSIGLPVQAIEYYTKALNLGGWDSSIFHLRALCYERIGKAEEATADARNILEMNPEDLQARSFCARMLISQKKFQEAEEEIAIAEKLNPKAWGINFTLSLLSAVRGEKEKALALVKPAEDDPLYYTYLLSRVYAVLGLKDKAIEQIKLGIEKGFQEVFDYIYEYPFLNVDYFFDKLRDDPRFIEILAQQKKKYEENLKKYSML